MPVVNMFGLWRNPSLASVVLEGYIGQLQVGYAAALMKPTVEISGQASYQS